MQNSQQTSWASLSCSKLTCTLSWSLLALSLIDSASLLSSLSCWSRWAWCSCSLSGSAPTSCRLRACMDRTVHTCIYRLRGNFGSWAVINEIASLAKTLVDLRTVALVAKEQLWVYFWHYACTCTCTCIPNVCVRNFYVNYASRASHKFVLYKLLSCHILQCIKC